MKKLLLLLALIAGAFSVQFAATTFSQGNFTLRLFPAGTADPSVYCFSSPCEKDQTIHFYMEEIYNSNYLYSPCEYAATLANSRQASDMGAITFEDGELNVNLASLLHVLYSSPTCTQDLLKAMESVDVFEQLGDSPVVEVNIIESMVHLDLDQYTCPETSCNPGSGVSRINIVIQDWCDSTCAYKDNCAGTDVGIEKDELDYVITRFEVKQLLHNWGKYIQEVTDELEAMKLLDEQNTVVNWRQINDVHESANNYLYFGGEDYQSLNWALSNVEQQLQGQRCASP